MMPSCSCFARRVKSNSEKAISITAAPTGSASRGDAPSRRASDQPGILEHDVCKPTEPPKRFAHAFGVKTIGAAQNRFSFQYHRRADEDFLTVDDGFGFLRLLGMIAREVANNEIGINREHDVVAPLR
jgi:hypothetical protein